MMKAWQIGLIHGGRRRQLLLLISQTYDVAMSVTRLPVGATIGILGGGQLGRMLALAAAPLGFKVAVYDPAPNSPAFEVCGQSFCAAWDDEAALTAFANACDVITLEFENVPLETVAMLTARTPVRPGAKALEVSQDRLVEKQFIADLGIPVAPFAPVAAVSDLEAAVRALGPDGILKTRRFGYDGKGQFRLHNGSDLNQAWAEIGGAPAILEGLVPFIAETSAIIARGADGVVVAWDCPANHHEGGILRRSSLPGPLDVAGQAKAVEIATTIASALNYVGVMTVEYFVTADGRLTVNEIAPRTHNSGHWTIEGAHTSQFANTIRAVAGWPLGATTRRFAAVEMINLVGDDVLAVNEIIDKSDQWMHLYGKGEVRSGRKMGHITRLCAQ
jgi:5-(carboxyamino)imidazole ribonucleotide synthase